MRTIEDSGLGSLGATTPVLTQPERVPIFRMLMNGQRYCAGPELPAPKILFRKSMGLELCNVEGNGIQCAPATPVSALGGLGAVTWSNVLCKSYDNALRNMQILLSEAERVEVTASVAYRQAKALLDDETAWAQWKHAAPLLPETCEQETLKAESLYSALNEIVKGAGGERGVDAALPSQQPSDKTADTIKVVAVAGGISIAVIGVIYLVGPFVRGLSKAGARRLR